MGERSSRAPHGKVQHVQTLTSTGQAQLRVCPAPPKNEAATALRVSVQPMWLSPKSGGADLLHCAGRYVAPPFARFIFTYT